MIYKLKVHFVAVLGLILLSMTSCSEFINGKPKKEMIIEVKKKSVNCLKEVPTDFEKFKKSEMTDAELDKSFNCLDKTLSEFQNKAEGAADKDAFTIDELHQIFSKFVKDADISKEATGDLLLLKSTLLGGSNQKITKSEISVLRTYLEAVKEEMKSLQPFVKVFTFKKEDTVFSTDMIKSAYAQLNLSLKNLLKLSKISQAKYQFSDLKNLLMHLKIINNEQIDILALAQKMNDLVVGGQEISNDQDRISYIDNLTEVLRLYTTQLNGYVKLSISDAEQMNHTFEYIHDAIDLLENTIQFKKTKLISIETIDPLITEILNKDILPLKLTTDTALNFYKILLVRVFESGLSGDVRAFTGIKKIHFVNLKRELAVYRIYQNYIQTISDKKSRVSIKLLQEKLKHFDIKAQQKYLHEFDRDEKEQIIAAVNEIREEFLVKKPVVYRFDKIVLSANQEIWDQNWDDLSRGLYNTMISRQLILGWSILPNYTKIIKSISIGEQGIVQWYSEFKKFGIETKIFDPRSKNSGLSNLLSANLFTHEGNGDDKLSFREAVQFVGILFSGGGKAYTEIEAGLKLTNCDLPELDVFGRNWNNELCVVENLRKNYKNYFSNLPYLVSYLDHLNKDDEAFKIFYNSLMKISRVDAKEAGRIETADLRNMTTLLHYLESLFAAYDENRNSTLSEKEIKASYGKFQKFAEKHARNTAADSLSAFSSWKGVVARYSCFSEQDLIRESFVFLVYNGRTPGVSDLTILPCTLNKPLIKFEGEIDRQRIINTLKIVKDVLGS